MAKKAIISRESVEVDIQREIDKGATPLEAARRVQWHAEDGHNKAKTEANERIREAKKGDVIDLLAAVRGLTPRAAALDLVQTFGLEPSPRRGTEKRNG